VLLVRTFVFRIHPSAQQRARLACWEGALRFVWNLAHEQHLLGLLRTDRRFPSWFDQKKELTLLRAEVPWINDLPANVGQAMLAHLDDAWKDFFAGKAGQPGFKVKDRDTMSIEEPSKTCWRLDARKNCLRFPKLGNVPLTLHQPLEGTPKTCSLVRDVDQWFAHITCEIEVPESTHEPSPSVIAIDLGVEVAFADSSGRLVPNPRLGEALAPTLAKRQRQLAKKQKGSNNRKKEKVKVAKVHRKLRRQRENFLHTWSHRYAKNHSVVVIEDLKLKNMTRSAKGTESEPGRNVAQKAGLNRALLDVAPGRFMSMLEYKTERHGGVVEHVPAAYSSQECSVCGHVASENRPTRSRFCCMACGHEDHADTNAAKVLMQRYTRRTGGEAACGGNPEKGPTKQEPKAVRSRTKALKRRGLKSLGLQAEDGLYPQIDEVERHAAQAWPRGRPAQRRLAREPLSLEQHRVPGRAEQGLGGAGSPELHTAARVGQHHLHPLPRALPLRFGPVLH
jgi:putative transposase